MRSFIIACCVAAQLSVLGYMVFGREQIISHGTQVVISTAPIDPRDPFRGDFVRLRYAMNTLKYAQRRWEPEDYEAKIGDVVYAVINENTGGLHDVDYYTNIEPESNTLFMRGRITTRSNWNGGNASRAKFGIEQLFVQQGAGYDIEERRGVRRRMQTAMHASVSIGDDGTAVLTGFDWSPLAMELNLNNAFVVPRPDTANTATTATAQGIETTSQNQAQNTTPADENQNDSEPDANLARLRLITITLKNVSENPVRLNNPGDNCGFQIEPAFRYQSSYSAADHSCQNLDESILTLLPEETLRVEVDLSLPRWHVTLENTEGLQSADVRSFNDSRTLFRIVYRSEYAKHAMSESDTDSNSSARDYSQSANDEAVWQGDVLSQGFTTRGRID